MLNSPLTQPQHDVFSVIHAALPMTINAPFIVGIDGCSTAGKTTFALSLRQYLQSRGRPSHVVHVDDFHYSRSERHAHDYYNGDSFYHHNHDFASLESQVLTPLSQFGSLHVSLQARDHFNDEVFTRNYCVDSNSVVILEGVFLCRPTIRQFVDYLIYLRVDDCVVHKRGIARFSSTLAEAEIHRRFTERYLAGYRIYATKYLPDRMASLLVDNTDGERPFIFTIHTH
jgi:uridine kinase